MGSITDKQPALSTTNKNINENKLNNWQKADVESAKNV